MEIDWIKYGFEEDSEYKGVYSRGDFPFYLWVTDGFLTVNDKNMEYKFSEGIIPATNQAVVLLLKAFNCPKLP